MQRTSLHVRGQLHRCAPFKAYGAEKHCGIEDAFELPVECLVSGPIKYIRGHPDNFLITRSL